MTLAFLIYFIAALDRLSGVYGWLMAGLTLTVAVSGFAYCAYKDDANLEEAAIWGKRVKIALTSIVVMSVVFAFVPSSKTAWLMVGGYAAQSAFESDTGEKLKAIVNAKLDEILAEQLAPQKPAK